MVLLKIVAQRLSKIAGSQGLVARLGGDEFGIALQSQRDTKKAAEELCIKLDQSFQDIFEIGSLALHLGCSFGISILGRDENELEEVLKFADIALYRAKATSNSIISFEQKMADEVSLTKQLEEDLRRALVIGDISVAYQPQVRIECETLVGIEALARWIHPHYGEIPSKFVRIAEDCGLIDQLGMYIVDGACNEISTLTAELGCDIRLSVNISTKQFYKGGLINDIVDILSKRKFNPNFLEVEVTETAFIRNMGETCFQLDSLRELGIHVALDDFGTGFSSLSYLRQVQVDRIKLDREFIKNIHTSEHDQRIVSGIIKLAHSIGIEIIAEGVENSEQKKILENFGCNEIQGFFYSRPLSITQLKQSLMLQSLVRQAHETGVREIQTA